MNQSYTRSSSPLFAGSSTLKDALWFIALGILAALLIPATRYLAGTQNGDGILTALISTQKLTWYFWEQDRFLNLIPALARPITDVEWNLRLQIFLRVFFAYLAPVGFGYFFTQSPRSLTLITAAANLLSALLFSQLATFNLYVEHNPFGTSLVLFAFSLYLLRRGETSTKWILAAIFTDFLAYTTNFALLTIALPLIALTFCMGALPRKQLAVFFAINLICIALAYVHSRHVGAGTSTPFNQLDISWRAAHAGYHSVGSNLRWKILLAFAAVATAAGLIQRTPFTLTALCLIAGSIVLVGVLSCSEWPQINEYHIRYYIIFILATMASISYLLIASFPWLARRRFTTVALCTGALLVEVFWPLSGITSDYSKLIGAPWRTSAMETAQAAVDHHAQLIIGDFWNTWPAAFETLTQLPEKPRGDDSVYGITFRSRVLRNRIRNLTQETHGLQALCLEDIVTTCEKTITDAMMLNSEIGPNSVQEITVGDKHMLLMRVTLTDPVPLTPDQMKSTLTLDSEPTFVPSKDVVRLSVEFSNEGTATFRSNEALPVRLSIKFLAPNGREALTNSLRTEIPYIGPGQKAKVTVEVPASNLNDKGIYIIPVQDGVAWFDTVGVKGVTLGPFKACTNSTQAWICDNSHRPLPVAE